MTQTEPISANEENSEEINTYPMTWENKRGIQLMRIEIERKKELCGEVHVEENVKDGLNIYIRKNNGTSHVPLKKAL